MRNNTHITIPINSDIYSMSNSDVIRHTILAMLPAARARSQLGNGGIDASTKLLSVGLVDSKDLLDIIPGAHQLRDWHHIGEPGWCV